MTARPQYRLSTETIAADRAILQAVATLADFTPANPAYNLASVQQLEAALTLAQQNEERLLREMALTREEVTMAAMALHEAIQVVKVQVEAQYGSDSPALHAVGLKRRSERKRPSRRRPAE